MTSQLPNPAPDRFVRLLKKAFGGCGHSLREVARRSEISPAYLSLLLNGERDVPDDAIIARLEQVLKVEPRGLLFDAAGRVDSVLAKVVKKDPQRLLMRSLEPLNDADFAKVLAVAEKLARKYHSDEK